MGHTGGVQGHHAAPGGVLVLCSAGPHACPAHASSLASGTDVPHTSVWPVTVITAFNLPSLVAWSWEAFWELPLEMSPESLPVALPLTNLWIFSTSRSCGE